MRNPATSDVAGGLLDLCNLLDSPRLRSRVFPAVPVEALDLADPDETPPDHEVMENTIRTHISIVDMYCYSNQSLHGVPPVWG